MTWKASARKKIRGARRRLRRIAVDTRDAASFARASMVVRWSVRRGSRGRAVVIHLHYPEAWPALVRRLHLIDSAMLVVTVNEHSHRMKRTIAAEFPHAVCVRVPNRGRDVLPFLSVARALDRAGYTSVLKLHSKKSTHFEAGDQWRDGMIDELIPEEPSALAEVLSTIDHPATGMIGPREMYFPLPTYYSGNAALIRRLLAPVADASQRARLDPPDPALGFFAGTMFWARLDALRPLLGVPVREFPPEPIPKDGSMAHALERALCVLPVFLGRTVYTCDGRHVHAHASASPALPTWYTDAVRDARTTDTA